MKVIPDPLGLDIIAIGYTNIKSFLNIRII